MPEDHLKIIEKLDLEFYNHLQKSNDFALSSGALPKKYKLLIAMALDTSKGSVEGVKFLVKEAMEAGATREEIMDTLRITQFVSGVGVAHTAATALEGMF
jgi:alkylhydroperoxidase/carboxymuconolactone decarboxylase family protein YurZ